MSASISKIKPVYFVLFVAVNATSWASIFIRLDPAPPLVTAFWRLLLSTIGMLILSKIFGQTQELNPRLYSKNQFLLLFLSGFFLAIHFSSWFVSLFYTSVAASVTITDSAPLFVVIGGFLFLRERVTNFQIIGILVSIIGGLIIGLDALGKTSGQVSSSLIGDTLALLAALAFAGYLLIGRNVRQNIGIFAYTSWVYGVCSFFLFIIALVNNPLELLQSFSFNIPWEAYALFVLLAIGPSILGHSLYNYSLKEVKAAIVSVISLGEAVIASILAFIIFGETPGILVIIGGICILIGVVISILKEKKSQTFILEPNY